MQFKIQKPLPSDTEITGIKIKDPKAIKWGNIKCWGKIENEYCYPQLFIKNSQMFPLFSLPIETTPNIRIFEYWLGKSFLPWNLAKEYIKQKDILSLVSVSNKPPAPTKQTFKNSRLALGKINLKDTRAAEGMTVPIPTWPEGNALKI
ncbi:hypothetical protein [Spiroplasma mirum]|nr:MULTISPECIES: hypothetical protein [Spiroplasma]